MRLYVCSLSYHDVSLNARVLQDFSTLIYSRSLCRQLFALGLSKLMEIIMIQWGKVSRNGVSIEWQTLGKLEIEGFVAQTMKFPHRNVSFTV